MDLILILTSSDKSITALANPLTIVSTTDDMISVISIVYFYFNLTIICGWAMLNVAL